MGQSVSGLDGAGGGSHQGKVPPPRNTAAHPPCEACAAPTAAEHEEREAEFAASPHGKTPFAYMHSECPLNRRELGRATWAFLHTMAAYYPDAPSAGSGEDMRAFLVTLGRVYPCGYCSDTTSQEIVRHPPRVESRQALAQWMCELHNEVNDRIGSPLFDCARVEERWRTGPPDGSCG